MDDVQRRGRKPWLVILRALAVGLVGGVGMVSLRVLALYLYDEYFAPSPPRDVRRRDPMAAVEAFYYFAAANFLLGAGLAIAADFALQWWRRRR